VTTGYGDGSFQFASWATPLADDIVDLLDVRYDAGTGDLQFRIGQSDSDETYSIAFKGVSAFRVLDEHGLLELWRMTEELDGRPGRTTFMVRNHAWCRESIVSFLPTDGWSYVLATDGDCIEVVCANDPSIRLD
jgi:hypothetical protein